MQRSQTGTDWEIGASSSRTKDQNVRSQPTSWEINRQALPGAGRLAARLRSAGVFRAWAQLAADRVEAPRFYIPGQEARPSSEAGKMMIPQTWLAVKRGRGSGAGQPVACVRASARQSGPVNLGARTPHPLRRLRRRSRRQLVLLGVQTLAGSRRLAPGSRKASRPQTFSSSTCVRADRANSRSPLAQGRVAMRIPGNGAGTPEGGGSPPGSPRSRRRWDPNG